MAIHHSGLASLKRCPMKFKYAYADKLERKREALPLKRGVWLHFMLQVDALRRGMEKGSLLEVPEVIDVPGGLLATVIPITDLAGGLQVLDEGERVAEYSLDWKGALALLEQQQWNYLPEEVKGELTEGGQDLPTACRNILRGYLWQHRAVLEQERPLLVEVEWERTDTSGAHPVDYGGRIDLVLFDAKGRLIVRDWKTTKSLPSPEYRLMERQRILYAWGIGPTLNQHGIERVDGIELDYLVTKTATKPKQNQPTKPKTRKAKCPDCEGSGTVRLGDEISEDTGERLGEDLACIACEGEGKRLPDQPTPNELKGELSKAKIDTTPLVYFEALKEYGLELTDPHRAKINELAAANAFYRRFPIPVNIKMLNKTLGENAQVAAVGAQILQTPSLAYRVEDRSCNWTCDFVPLCMGELYGQDVSTIRKRDYQLRKALVDPLDNDDEE